MRAEDHATTTGPALAKAVRSAGRQAAVGDQHVDLVERAKGPRPPEPALLESARQTTVGRPRPSTPLGGRLVVVRVSTARGEAEAVGAEGDVGAQRADRRDRIGPDGGLGRRCGPGRQQVQLDLGGRRAGRRPGTAWVTTVSRWSGSRPPRTGWRSTPRPAGRCRQPGSCSTRHRLGDQVLLLGVGPVAPAEPDSMTARSWRGLRTRGDPACTRPIRSSTDRSR